MRAVFPLLSIVVLLTLHWTAISAAPHVPDASVNSQQTVHLRVKTLHVDKEYIAQRREEGKKSLAKHISLMKKKARSAPLLQQTSSSASTLSQYLLHVKGPVTTTLKDKINAALQPYSLGQYVPHNTFLVVGPSVHHPDYVRFHETVSAVSSVRTTSLFKSEFKIDPLLTKKQEALFQASPSLSYKSHFVAAVHAQSDKCVGVNAYRLLNRNQDNTVTLRVQVESGFLATFPIETLIEREWKLSFAAANVPVKDMKVVSPRAALVTVHESLLSQSLSLLSQRSEVHWIEEKPVFQMLNRFARYVVQDNVPLTTRIWNMGLKGRNQIIAVGDTGVDYDSCFFRDDEHEVSIGSGRVNLNHRKIVQYVLFGAAQAGDEPGGHGTHVAGSLSGAAPDSSSLSSHNGMAPEAKLAVFDFKGPQSDDLYVPDDLYNSFYGESYNTAGARIMSNSWGSPDGAYSDYAADTDRFAWDHKDYLAVFAAGNYGNDRTGEMTIASPGVAKNILTVGSSKSQAGVFFELGQGAGLTISSPQSIAGGPYRIEGSAFGRRLGYMDPLVDSPIVIAEPRDACSALTGGTEKYQNKIVLVLRGTCVYTIKAKRVQDAGAVFMLVMQSTDEPAEGMGGDDGSISIASAMVGKSIGQLLVANPDARISLPVPFVRADDSERFMSSFSSRGPTSDGRRKPDVLAPGEYIVSARSDGTLSSRQCPTVESGLGLLEMQGTSMATPIAAGSAAMVRQYFTEGFYPSGARNPADSITPSSALMKAIMIQSGQSVGGTVSSDNLANQGVTSIPSYFQGYGRIQLGRTLWFSGPTNISSVRTDNWRLWMTDSHSLNTFDSNLFCFKVTETVPDDFKVTLVWTDYPSSTSASMLLNNNLDLLVSGDSEDKKFVGNSRSFSSASGEHLVYDELNNVEQVYISSATGSSDFKYYGVRVYGAQIPHGPQPYALVVTGNIELMSDVSLCQSASVCPANCNADKQHGNCVSGRCVCSRGWTGASCSISSSSLLSADVNTPSGLDDSGSTKLAAWVATAHVETEAWSYFHLDVTEEIIGDLSQSLRIVLKRDGGNGDPDLYISFNSFPTLNNHEWNSNTCDPCGDPPAVVTIGAGELQVGRYIIGVYGYCCKDSDVKVLANIGSFKAPVVHTTSPSETPNSLGKGLISTGAVLMGIGVLLIFAVKMYTKFCRGSSSPAAPMTVLNPAAAQNSAAITVAPAHADAHLPSAQPSKVRSNGYSRLQENHDDHDDHDDHVTSHSESSEALPVSVTPASAPSSSSTVPAAQGDKLSKGYAVLQQLDHEESVEGVHMETDGLHNEISIAEQKGVDL